jgi:hypothetical protein
MVVHKVYYTWVDELVDLVDHGNSGTLTQVEQRWLREIQVCTMQNSFR